VPQRNHLRHVPAGRGALEHREADRPPERPPVLDVGIERLTASDAGDRGDRARHLTLRLVVGAEGLGTGQIGRLREASDHLPNVHLEARDLLDALGIQGPHRALLEVTDLHVAEVRDLVEELLGHDDGGDVAAVGDEAGQAPEEHADDHDRDADPGDAGERGVGGDAAGGGGRDGRRVHQHPEPRAEHAEQDEGERDDAQHDAAFLPLRAIV